MMWLRREYIELTAICIFKGLTHCTHLINYYMAISACGHERI